jgi:uncharacterized membrane protein HdeD (DUF308 family)
MSNSAVRTIDIILGLVAIICAILVLIYPGLAIGTILFLFGIAMIAIGILRVGSALPAGNANSARAINVMIGLLALVIGIVILAFPLLSVEILILLLAIGILLYGLGRIAVGGVAGNLSGWLRATLVIAGVIMVAFAILVIIFPLLGVLTLAIYLSISLLFIGIESLTVGIAPPKS